MPELPDVERFRRVLCEHAVGETVRSVEVRDPGVIRATTAELFAARLTHRRFVGSERIGKWLIARTGGPCLVVHFGMTGSLEWVPSGTDAQALDRVRFEFADGWLVYRDQRKLRGLWLAEGGEGALSATIGEIGPDALGLDPEQLADRLEHHRGALKARLMDQRVIAGLGNMLSDETLWRAHIHPRRSFGDLADDERRRLSRCLQQVLQASVRAGMIPRTRTWLSSQRAVPHPRCPRDHEALHVERIGGRTSYFCTRCQPATG